MQRYGGCESFLYYISRFLQDKDITIIYKIAYPNQINKLKKYARVIKWTDEMQEKGIKCKKIYYNYYTDIADFVEAEEHIQVLHTDYKEQINNIGYGFVRNPKIDRYIAPTKVVAEHFTEKYGLPCEVISNPIVIDKPKKVLNLISATRLSKEKGRDRMIRLGELLDQANIPYIWTIFTNDRREIKNDHIIYMTPTDNIYPYIKNADYLVQLSDNGEGFGYTVAESLMLGIPVIVTPVESFLEIGVKDNENGFVVPFSMNKVDVSKIYKSRLKFKYEPPESKWREEVAKGKSNYKDDGKIAIEITQRYYDCELNKWVEPTKTTGDCITVTKERADYLVRNGVAKYE